MKKAVFFDRDGIIVKLIYNPDERRVETVKEPNQIEFMEGIAGLLKYTHEKGFLNIIASNQAGVGLKKISKEKFGLVREEMTNKLAERGGVVDGQYYCFHFPTALIDEYKKDCDCRKPKPGMILEAAAELGIGLAESWMIGDGINDVIAGRAAGCKTILLENNEGLEYARPLSNEFNIVPDYVVRKLDEIKDIIR